ncbi:L-rhamnose-binding lectin ELEL-1-like [Branchiostoma floridae x Branchiostoma japonicum]
MAARLLLTVGLVLLVGQATSLNIRSIACDYNSLRLNCNTGLALNILSSMYGRITMDVCRHSSIHTTDCRTDSLSFARSFCQARQSCTLSHFHLVLGDPCPYTHKYLEVVYNCQPYAYFGRGLEDHEVDDMARLAEEAQDSKLPVEYAEDMTKTTE